MEGRGRSRGPQRPGPAQVASTPQERGQGLGVEWPLAASPVSHLWDRAHGALGHTYGCSVDERALHLFWDLRDRAPQRHGSNWSPAWGSQVCPRSLPTLGGGPRKLLSGLFAEGYQGVETPASDIGGTECLALPFLLNVLERQWCCDLGAPSASSGLAHGAVAGAGVMSAVSGDRDSQVGAWAWRMEPSNISSQLPAQWEEVSPGGLSLRDPHRIEVTS